MITRRQLVFAFVVGVFVLTALSLARTHLLSGAAHWLDVGDVPRRGDYVMVLPGDENTRPFVAAALVNAELAKAVLVLRPRTSPAMEDGVLPPTHEITCRVLEHRGVAKENIRVCERRGSGTFGDVEALAGFLESAPQARVAVVTNHYHTRRVRWTVSRVLGPRARQVSLVSAPTDDFRIDRWWEVDAGFRAIVGEYLKLTYYVLWYTRICYWIAGCAAVAAVVLAYRRLRTTAV